MIVPFTKMSGAGNDFIVIDRRSETRPFEADRYISLLCDRRRGIGADGVIVLKSSPVNDFSMEYYNADGSTGSFCGNGGRCAASLVLGEADRNEATFEACGRVHRAVRSADGIILEMGDPAPPRLDISPGIPDVDITGHFIDTGSPHLVLFGDYPDFGSMDIIEIGRKIRNSETFAPGGTNVDFVRVVGEGHLAVRTYERGVENETLACGTGAVASAVVYDITGKNMGKGGNRSIRITPRSGEDLVVHFTRQENRISNVRLEGPALVTYMGTFDTGSFVP